MACRKRIVFQIRFASENNIFPLWRRRLLKTPTVFNQLLDSLDAIQAFDVFCTIIGHQHKQIISCSADRHIDDVSFIEEHIRIIADIWWRIEHSKDNIAFVALEAVDCADLNLYLLRNIFRSHQFFNQIRLRAIGRNDANSEKSVWIGFSESLCKKYGGVVGIRRRGHPVQVQYARRSRGDRSGAAQPL